MSKKLTIIRSATMNIEKVKSKRELIQYDKVSKYVPTFTLIGKNDKITGVRDILCNSLFNPL